MRLVLFPPKTVRRADVQRFVAEAGLRARPALMGVAAWENPSAVPRAYVTYRVLAAPPVDELLGALARPEFDPMAASYVEGAPPFEPAADAPARGVPAAIVEDGDRAVAIDATLERQGLVVLADTVFPGWRATVDGTPAPIVPTNHLFRGVPVPAGRHRVRFEYHPRSVRTGVALSAVGVAALVAAARRRDA